MTLIDPSTDPVYRVRRAMERLESLSNGVHRCATTAQLIADGFAALDTLRAPVVEPATPAAQWTALKAEMSARIEAIDRATPWAETEPRWWLEMMEVKRHLL
jgi:hypothetical protein